MSGKFTGSIGANYALQRFEMGWAFVTFIPLILRCWQSRRGSLSMGHTRCSTKCIKQGTSPFMEAKLGCNPSYVWRSLPNARELIRVGSVWTIGDGRSVGIQTHKWLPHTPTFHDGVDLTLKVVEFINPQTKQWDRGKVNAWFQPPSRDEVLRIRLGSLESRDTLVWNENKAQTFSVRTTYHVALQMNRTGIGEHSRVREGKQVWNRLWKLSVPPKVRNFVWWASSNILPTQANLARRRVPIDPKCVVCGSSDETVFHILWQCPLAQNV